MPFRPTEEPLQIRDLQIVEGINQIQRNIIARTLLGSAGP